MTLGDLVKEYRDKNNISMEEFSNMCQLSKGYISMLENNINPRNNKPIAPTLPTIKKIALAMRTDVDSILKALDSDQEINLESNPERAREIRCRVKESRENKYIIRNDFADMQDGSNMTFGERLALLRKENGYSTRKSFAEKLNIPETTLRNYETNEREAGHTFLKQMSDFFDVSCDYLLGLTDEKEKYTSHQLKSSEYVHIEKYRFISEQSPEGAKMVDAVLDREYKITEQMQALKANHPAIIEFHNKADNTERLLEYFRSASAGTGVFILGNEASEQIAIPNTPENQYADFAIGVDGNSMEPDYHDGDIVLVSQKLEINYGDVGIFVINNKAYIKEYGETELISRNPAAGNIKISEYDNIVCMGKVIGKPDREI